MACDVIFNELDFPFSNVFPSTKDSLTNVVSHFPMTIPIIAPVTSNSPQPVISQPFTNNSISQPTLSQPYSPCQCHPNTVPFQPTLS